MYDMDEWMNGWMNGDRDVMSYSDTNGRPQYARGYQWVSSTDWERRPHLTRRRGAHPRQRLRGKNRIFDGDMISQVTAFVDLGPPQGDQLGEPQQEAIRWGGGENGMERVARKAARVGGLVGRLETQLSCELLLFLGFPPGQGFLHPSHHIYLALLVID